jgi:hypothetical protein
MWQSGHCTTATQRCIVLLIVRPRLGESKVFDSATLDLGLSGTSTLTLKSVGEQRALGVALPARNVRNPKAVTLALC